MKSLLDFMYKVGTLHLHFDFLFSVHGKFSMIMECLNVSGRGECWPKYATDVPKNC